MNLKKTLLICAVTILMTGCSAPSPPVESPPTQPAEQRQEPRPKMTIKPELEEITGPLYTLPTAPDLVAQIAAGQLTTPEHAVGVLQLLFDQEYQAFLNLDSSYLDPTVTHGWVFPNGDYEFLTELAQQGAHTVGHAPARILSAAQVTQLPSDQWELTVVTSELGLEIIGPDNEVLIDTRGDGPVVSTYTIAHVAN